MAVNREALERFFNDLLKPDEFDDYGPNGLQIEGLRQLSRIAFAVSATVESANKAVQEKVHALVVHHGLFWKFHGARPLTGPFAQRIKPLVKQDINLFAYHLPLDAHIEIGNAASLGKYLGLEQQRPFGDYKGCPTGTRGILTPPVKAAELQEKLRNILNHEVLLASPDKNALLESVGIITGGANNDWILALQAGLDGYVTGEMSEHNWHESQEAGIHMFAGGHNATEQFGIQSLMAKVQDTFDVECLFIPSENPA